ncbi:Uncharacterised protein [Mesomycoplasma hyorhinis]|nr:Uncharacterised protein [Mesomycoplasma hyorhinis]
MIPKPIGKNVENTVQIAVQPNTLAKDKNILFSLNSHQ